MAGRLGMGTRIGAATMLVALALSGCDWRIETQPSPTPTADAATSARDAAAVNESAILDALGAPALPGSGRESLEALEALAAPVHLELLGGVYEPFPSAAPSPSPTPPPLGALRAAASVARDDALDFAFAHSETEGAFLAGSIGFSHAFALWFAGAVDATAAGVVVAPIAERTLPGQHGDGVALVPPSSALSAADLADLAVRHDQARFLYEVIAARESGDRRALALARAAEHRERSDALAALAGQDDRAPIYELPGALVDTPEARDQAGRDAEQALGWRYLQLTSVVNATDRAWLMSAAFDAYTDSALMPGFTPAQFPVLPGVDRADLP